MSNQVDTLDDPIIELFMLAVMSTMREPTLPEFRAKLLAREVAIRIDEVNRLHELVKQEFGYETPWMVEVRDNRIKELEKQREADSG